MGEFKYLGVSEPDTLKNGNTRFWVVSNTVCQSKLFAVNLLIYLYNLKFPLVDVITFHFLLHNVTYKHKTDDYFYYLYRRLL